MKTGLKSNNQRCCETSSLLVLLLLALALALLLYPGCYSARLFISANKEVNSCCGFEAKKLLVMFIVCYSNIYLAVA